MTYFYVIKIILTVYNIIFPSLGVLGKTMYYKNMCYCVSRGATVTQHGGKQKVFGMRREDGAHSELHLSGFLMKYKHFIIRKPNFI